MTDMGPLLDDWTFLSISAVLYLMPSECNSFGFIVTSLSSASVTSGIVPSNGISKLN